MAGVTDSPFRRLAKRFGAGVVFTECISAEGMRRQSRITIDLARFTPEERPIALQLFGSDPGQLAEAAAVAASLFSPDLMDINCGCPVRKFVVRGCGGFLMQDPDLIGRMVEAVRAASGLPVSVKIRAGYRYPEVTAAQAAVAAQQAGAAFVTVHGRFVRGAKGTPADWEVIGRVKAAVTIPVVGNGDVRTAEGAAALRRLTGCDRVMIGRGALGRPFIFAQLAGFPPPPPRERIALLIEHYGLAREWYPERAAVRVMRKHIAWYTAGLSGSAALRAALMREDDPERVVAVLQSFRLTAREGDGTASEESYGALLETKAYEVPL